MRWRGSQGNSDTHDHDVFPSATNKAVWKTVMLGETRIRKRKENLDVDDVDAEENIIEEESQLAALVSVVGGMSQVRCFLISPFFTVALIYFLKGFESYDTETMVTNSGNFGASARVFE